VRVTAGPGIFIVCNEDNGKVFFIYSTQILGLLCSEFFLQYGLWYIYIFILYVTALQKERFRVQFPLGSLQIFK